VNVKKFYLTPSWHVLIASSAAACVAVAAPGPPPAPAPPNVRADGDLDAQLEAARKRLEQAAHEVAQLSSQLSGTVIDQVMPFEPVTPSSGAAGAGHRHCRRARARGESGGAGRGAGIHVGDVIVAVNGTELKGDEPARQVVRIMRDVKPDARVQLRVLRDGKTRELSVTARPGPAVLASVHGLSDSASDRSEWHGTLMLQGRSWTWSWRHSRRARQLLWQRQGGAGRARTGRRGPEARGRGRDPCHRRASATSGSHATAS